ncbi:MAG TPA: hypothetical protein ENN19_15645, partial [Chloroflexi bacterium]|nr:hypothetical protein [Chloroflexota bacterium]
MSNGTWWECEYPPFGYDLNGIWGSSDGALFAVGEQGTLLRYFDGMWNATQMGDGAHYDVWGFSAADAIAVGDLGGIYRYADGAWAGDGTSVITENIQLRSVWGSTPNDIFAVGVQYGGGSRIYHYDGVQWNKVFDAWPMMSVWGNAPNDVFVVGSGILHYDGIQWVENYDIPFQLYDVWGSSPTDVFAVGENGGILHYDGATWSRMDSGTTGHLRGIHGDSATNIYAVG